jgi:glycosyltransferase involved in cell wall biosynthesis
MKKVLIITYYWPPSGGIGVHRCLKFAKYLREFGWEPVVFTAKNAQYPVFDETNFKHVPKDLEVHQIPIFEPYNLFRKISGRKKTDSANPLYVRDRKPNIIDNFSIWFRGNFFIPDARACWIRPSVRAISKYLRNNNSINAIFSDGPPHSNTRIAYHIAKKFNIPWLADFQDPWTQVDYYKLFKISYLSDKIHRKMEQGVFKQADKITIASPSWASDLERIGAKNVDVLYYGYDEDDFINRKISDSDLQKIEILKNKFVINHAGLLGLDRFPKTFLDVLAKVCQTNVDFKDKLLIFFPGEVDYSIIEYIYSLGLENQSVFPGHISKELAIESMILSDILLLPLNKADNVAGRLPGKIYEYMRSYTPILALGPEGTDVEKILKDTKTGKCINYDDSENLESFVYETFNNAKPPFESRKVSESIKAFSVKSQTEKLGNLLNQIIR